MICNCELCRHSPARIGFKAWRKWNARYIADLKRAIKRLKDSGVKMPGFVHEDNLRGRLAVLEETLWEQRLLNVEVRK